MSAVVEAVRAGRLRRRRARRAGVLLLAALMLALLATSLINFRRSVKEFVSITQVI